MINGKPLKKIYEILKALFKHNFINMLILYNPFEDFKFDEQKCFLTGENLNLNKALINVFPEWLIDRYSLEEKAFSMLGGNVVKYPDMKLPCSPAVAAQLNSLDNEIKEAFTNGFSAVKKISKKRLFQWMAKLVYGILYHDIVFAKNQQSKKGEIFKLSDLLTTKFANLHLLLQSLVLPIEFKEPEPWTIQIFKVRYSKDLFNYKDETNNLNFSLGMHDFGIIACLQDNGENKKFHKELIEKIGAKTLHPIQFEELCARFIYSNYLLDTTASYDVESIGKKIFLEVTQADNQTGLFRQWDDKMFSQVLAEYWKPWGLTKSDIFSFPNSPISYLIDEYSNEIIGGDKISLPY